jgi:hypothetical protein
VTTKRVIPGGDQLMNGYRHIDALVDLLLERGHTLVFPQEPHGLHPSPAGPVCDLYGRITPQDWAAINDEFELPPTLVYEFGIIRDHANWLDIVGWDG